MPQILTLNENYVDGFEKLFTAYYTELDCGEDIPHLLDEYVIPDFKAGLISIQLLKDGEVFAGFVIYQKDDLNHEWNLREGWGDVREIYVTPSHRRAGFGKALLLAAECDMKGLGVDKCYCLPTDESVKFFETCGYMRGNLYNEELDCFVYEKKLDK